MDDIPQTSDSQDGRDDAQRVEELEQVNHEFAELVELLLDRLEGEQDDEQYAYSFQSGWKEKEQDSVKDELASDDLDAQLREIRQLKQKYR
ncbi:MAG: hypothetical protein SV186_05965 [Candidatus Nanohaloarchaea archaeon]|nr:hypothetical protein [Candidatus Nanohaloarchaea archaeon]